MKKVLFAAFAGTCVLTSIMATPADKGKKVDVSNIKHSLTDTVPPGKDTTKVVGVYDQQILTDTIPPGKDTTKKVVGVYVQEILNDTVPPGKKDTTKVIAI